MHRTHAGHGSIGPDETCASRASDQSTLTPERIAELRELLAKAEDAATRMAQNKSSLTDLITFRSIVNALPALLDATERVGRLKSAMAEAYQAVGSLLADAGLFENENAIRLLDVLSYGEPQDGKPLLPFPSLQAALATRAREDALREAARVAESLETLEVWLPTGPNGEGKDRHATIHGAKIAAAILALIDKPKGGDANEGRSGTTRETRHPATSPGVITGASGEAKQVDPDWFWCEIDPDESGDSAYQAMFTYRPRLEPVELCTSYVGPRLWGVMSPPLPDADNDEETAHTFDTREAAQAFCDERNAIFNGAALCPSEGADRG